MRFPDDFRWRFFRLAASVHEFAAIAMVGSPQFRRRQWRRGTLIALAGVLLLDIATCSGSLSIEQPGKASLCPMQLGVSRPHGSRHCFEVATLPGHVYADVVVPRSPVRSSK